MSNPKKSANAKNSKKRASANSAPKSPNVRAGRPSATPAKRTNSGKAHTDGFATGLVAVEVKNESKATPRLAFPVVGIGASAGGLEALEQFLANVPTDSGMAYVVVQHLDPMHKGAMIELLQRRSSIPVVQVTDRMRALPNRVFVIPPNSDMSILHGTLHLLPPVAPRGHNLPIDFFFRSLAQDQQEGAIGVILSGMGTDGTLGLRAIKENAGVCFVQAASSAKFDGMPTSAIDAGVADVVAPVEDLPERILAYRKHARLAPVGDVPFEDKAQSALEKVFVLLRSHTGNDFSLYKRSTIYRRIERRMSLHQIDTLAKYVKLLRETPKEIELLFKELLIGVTSFFRDPVAWDKLARDVVPAILSAHPDGVLRAWVAGCSTGEEAYSLAIAFREAVARLRPPRNVSLQIFATDLDREAIERARHGVYPANIAADVSPERLRRFFLQEEHGYRVNKNIREMVVFAPQNIIMDPPFTKLDILSCRNVLIYLAPGLQKRLIPLFHYSLNTGGILFLGSAETIGGFTSLFDPMDGKSRLYRRRESGLGAFPVEFHGVFGAAQTHASSTNHEEAVPPKPSHNIQALADRVLVQRFSPVGILCNDKGDILYISGRSGKYLEPPSGKANWNVVAMAREGLRYRLSTAFAAAVRGGRPIVARAVKVAVNDHIETVDITVEKLADPDLLRGTVMIVIGEVHAEESAANTKAHKATAGSMRISELEKELHHAREETQIVREEMQTSQEELKSTNEELQSTNEELQSTNEELTTSKEEMQSMNEELQTVNHELQSKVDELSRSNNDMKNLLNSTDIATLFLDGALLVRRFTTQTSKIIKLIPGDAGRPITDIATEIEYPDLADDAREVLRTLVFKEKVVAARDGNWFAVRILPYRTLENVIDGVVITFTDATAAKNMEQMLREQASQLQQMADALPNLIWSFRPDGACDHLSRQWTEFTGVPEADQLGYGWLEQLHPDDREPMRSSWNGALKSGVALNAEFRIEAKNKSYRWFQSHTQPIRDVHGTIVKWYGSSTDIDDLKRGDERSREATAHWATVLNGISEAFVLIDDNLDVRYFNSAAEQLLGKTRSQVVGGSLDDVFGLTVGSAFDKNCRDALRDRRARQFEASFAAIDRKGPFHVRVHPHELGMSIFVEILDPTGSSGGRHDPEKERPS